MGKLINLITNTHENNKRNYFDRMFNSKVRSMKIARKFDKHFWDGKRRYGYGGYKYVRNYWKARACKWIRLLKVESIYIFNFSSRYVCQAQSHAYWSLLQSKLAERQYYLEK